MDFDECSLMLFLSAVAPGIRIAGKRKKGYGKMEIRNAIRIKGNGKLGARDGTIV